MAEEIHEQVDYWADPMAPPLSTDAHRVTETENTRLKSLMSKTDKKESIIDNYGIDNMLMIAALYDTGALEKPPGTTPENIRQEQINAIQSVTYLLDQQNLLKAAKHSEIPEMQGLRMAVYKIGTRLFESIPQQNSLDEKFTRFIDAATTLEALDPNFKTAFSSLIESEQNAVTKSTAQFCKELALAGIAEHDNDKAKEYLNMLKGILKMTEFTHEQLEIEETYLQLRVRIDRVKNKARSMRGKITKVLQPVNFE